MAHRHTTPLGDFPRFLGSSDEDPDAHIQLFELICGAHEIVDDGRKVCIFPATLRGDASEWYANLSMQERATYDDLKTHFLRKFRGLGFEEKLAEQFDQLGQGASESIDKYIDRMDTIVRKLGNSAPDKETLKRRFLVGLHDEEVERYIRLKRPVSLEEAKHEARIWEENECRAKKESRSREEVNRDRVCGSQKRKGGGSEIKRKITQEVKVSKVNMTEPSRKNIPKKTEAKDPRKDCKGKLGDGSEKRKGSSKILVKQMDHNEHECLRKCDVEISRGDALTIDEGVVRKGKFSKQMNALYEEIERECKGIAKHEQKCYDLHDGVSDLEKNTLGTMWLCRMNPCFEEDAHFEKDEHL
ncbi:hypothetical protein KP509_38G053500 [Ceratopteris richardii]|uniref:Retrotransposon gag domain-containing protein n=1 Tax=Ceratopteris richardii TaxID=49495 RepID=A0A8T2Q4Z6_CERRI|nr:hypothetical protein KP509_38G053500 [Ceratopteris richardii]